VTLELLDEAVAAGARLSKACETAGVSIRTVERWRSGPAEDQRRGPRTKPPNKLSDTERKRILEVVNSPEYRDLSPNQIVPRLADQGEYIGSESTMYRILRQEGQQNHRGRSKAPERRGPSSHEATGPNQLLSWDITYLRCSVRGRFFYLYMVVDVWSRKIVGWEVHAEECMELSSRLIRRICKKLGVEPNGIVLHSDNGGPMKGSTMLATLQRLGIVASFSRPSVSNDNPFSESLFRTMKYRPEYPSRAFASLEEARAWVAAFVEWYNTQHLHSGIRFVTPDDRHHGRDSELLAGRRAVYERARQRHPNRWSRGTRNWTPIDRVHLNPEDPTRTASRSTQEVQTIAA
jgi:transposase InsO family protein